MNKAIIFNVQRFSLQDGPGIRTTVFFKGCPLRCLWCSNPESQNTFPEVGHRNTICTKCAQCVEKCPSKAISFTEEGTSINRKLCKNCGQCIETCVVGARNFYGKEMIVDQVFEEVKRDEEFYMSSGGGVTASGGEPLLHADFVAELFQRCRENNIHTSLETCGYAESSAWEKVLPHTNLVLFDLKLMDAAAHNKWTGKSNEIILSSLKLVADLVVPAIIRIPVIPGVNDSEKNMNDSAKYIRSLGLKKVQLMPYHQYGASKYDILDRHYSLSELKPQTDEQLRWIINIFQSHDLDCEIVR
jgi:pyruvate formate lyase activating enzyme